ncbi:Zinc finger C3H1 domain-containing protein [Bagarius yarrelli]|uniref:Zinc finger C3H1 domain-containing protein n=1 Tax=Bagarius yarrelli TaxID=175774 RepID=A0A556VC80_BAGYA|nr:Zinc finger C3H1 domain-containing protein [Bagarius yarrelli]
MDPVLSCGSPREEGELEDGEICDDEVDEKPRGARPGPGPGRRKPKTSTPRSKPSAAGLGIDFRSPPPLFRAGAMLHAPFPSCAAVPERLEPPSPRSNFWERSHGALNRYRGRTGQSRGDRARGTGRGRNIHRKESPNWKQKQGARAAGRKPMYVSSKVENGVDESFEDLLMKYKQIQLELECIRNQERRALKPGEDSPHTQQEDTPTAQTPQEAESNRQEELEERKAFQAFNLRPLRQKLLTPAERDALNCRSAQGVEPKEAEHNGEAEKSPLPRHKSVVVRLNASDDSDSEMEASGSVQSVFGGLESMIKEARRNRRGETELIFIHVLHRSSVPLQTSQPAPLVPPFNRSPVPLSTTLPCPPSTASPVPFHRSSVPLHRSSVPFIVLCPPFHRSLSPFTLSLPMSPFTALSVPLHRSSRFLSPHRPSVPLSPLPVPLQTAPLSPFNRSLSPSPSLSPFIHRSSVPLSPLFSVPLSTAPLSPSKLPLVPLQPAPTLLFPPSTAPCPLSTAPLSPFNRSPGPP